MGINQAGQDKAARQELSIGDRVVIDCARCVDPPRRRLVAEGKLNALHCPCLHPVTLATGHCARHRQPGPPHGSSRTGRSVGGSCRAPSCRQPPDRPIRRNRSSASRHFGDRADRLWAVPEAARGQLPMTAKRWFDTGGRRRQSAGGTWTWLTAVDRVCATRSPTPRPHTHAVDGGPRPVDLAVVAEPVQQLMVHRLPHPGLLPVAQPPPAGHPAATAKLLPRPSLSCETTSKRPTGARNAGKALVSSLGCALAPGECRFRPVPFV
jgi:hypothetical protein